MTKLKLVKVEDDFFECLVDGVLCRYLIQRPQPLDVRDAAMLRNVMDTHFLETLARPARASFFQRFEGLVRPGKASRSWAAAYRESVADYIEKVGVEVALDGGAKGVVLLRADIDKIREGRI
jgi:hypothetical protein